MNTTSVSYIYSEKLQGDLDLIFNQKYQAGRNSFQLGGVDINDLFLKYPRMSFILELIDRNPLYLSRLEYARRLLGHLNNKIPENNQILNYLFYIECIYTRLGEPYTTGEIKDSKKRIKNMLKANDKNIFLWIMYAEHTYLKGKVKLI